MLTIILIIAIALCTCCTGRVQTEKDNGKNQRNPTSLVLSDSSTCTDTLTLCKLADTVFYVNLHHKDLAIKDVQYFDSIIFVHDIVNGVFAFDGSGKLLYCKNIPSACFDVNADSKRFYIYSFISNEVKVYDWSGKEVESIRLLADRNSLYGNYFLAINDSLFIRANHNTGDIKHELLFFNRKGRVVSKRKNYEPFAKFSNATTYHEIWNRPLYKTSQGLRFHRCYGDTVFSIGSDRILRPVLIEQKIKKVPLSNRLEVVGGNEIEYLNLCDKEGFYGTRMYENSRFFLIEALIGKSSFRLPNFLLYDRKNNLLSCIENNITKGLENGTLHFGIFNDYDGGLAFAPICQSGDFLIMANAGETQGKAGSHPKSLYTKGRKISGLLYKCRSDVFSNIENRNRLEDFFQHFDDEKDTMLMIVKLKNETLY